MRQRVLTIMGLAVGLLVMYTLLFGSGGGWREGDILADSPGRLLATRAVPGGEEDAGQGRAGAGERKPAPADEKPGEVSEPVIWGSDPFVRDWVLTDELSELNLKAITMGGDKAFVLINDQILEQGDAIGGKRIAAIQSDKVVLEQGGRSFILMLGE